MLGQHVEGELVEAVRGLARLEGFGLPEFLVLALADADARIAEGAPAAATDTLATLLGRPTTTLAEAVSQGLGR